MTGVGELASIAVQCGLDLYRRLGPGLLEHAYEKVLAHMLRANMVAGGKLLLEIKPIDRLHEMHAKQVLTCLHFMELQIGLLMNFGGTRFSDGLKRVVNNHRDTDGSNLRLHQ